MISTPSNIAIGTNYERFVQSIYNTLFEEDGLENVLVQHNKTDLVGKSGCKHQIDVYWEFEFAGVTYSTAIECKAFSSKVSIGHIRNFYGVLVDVPNLNGIFVTLVGFQDGAKRYADHYGIALKEIREPAEADWQGRVKDVHIKVFIIDPVIRSIKPVVNAAYTGPLEFTSVKTNYDPLIVDSRGNKIASHEEIRALLPTDNQAEIGQTKRFSYTDAHLRGAAGYIPIDYIDVTYDVNVEIDNIEIYGERFAKAIIKDVKSGEMRFRRSE